MQVTDQPMLGDREIATHSRPAKLAMDSATPGANVRRRAHALTTGGRPH